MIIGVTGYGCSGASACMDVLKEFEDVQYYNPNIEFQLLQQPDGIRDLRFHLIESRRRISISTAITRFIQRTNFARSDFLSVQTKGQYKKLSQEYVESLIQMRWQGKSGLDPKDLLSPLERPILRLPNALIKRIIWLFNSKGYWPPARERYYSCIDEKYFNLQTEKYMNAIFLASGFDLQKPIILEQLFCLEFPLEGAEYFCTDCKSIIVERDPRDIFMDSNGYFASAESFMPNTGNVEDFVQYYSGLHHASAKDPNVLYLQYEDLIYDYENTIDKLEDFTGLKHVYPRKHFKPEWSVNNTQTFKLYPQYDDKIRYIEENLSEYLYPFEEKHLNFIPENVGIFIDVPGDRNRLMARNKI